MIKIGFNVLAWTAEVSEKVFPIADRLKKIGPDVPAALVSTRPDTAEASRWSLAALNPGDGYAGAVVTAGSDSQLRCWDLRAI